MHTPETARQPRKDTLATRRHMIDAAESLFAEHGVDNVTMLDIARAAGQKNRNAPQYHFGDKAGIINAVLDKHSDLAVMNVRADDAFLGVSRRSCGRTDDTTFLKYDERRINVPFRFL